MFPSVNNEDITQVTSLNRTSSSRDAQSQHSSQNTPVAKQNRERPFKMLIKELIFLIVVVVITYGAIHKTPTNVSKQPPAVRFFQVHAPVTDWYKGQLSDALTVVNKADISFVMYYAPWDAESQYVKKEFEKAAHVLGDLIHFSGINCWNPGSECRLHHSKIPSWPILMAYTMNSKGVLYKGPRNAHNMVRFLELIMRPLERISRTEDLVNLLSYCDAVAIGYTPLLETSKHYSVWYSVALKSREYGIMGEICFGVVTSVELAAELGVDSLPSARLMLWNDTKEYNSEDDLTPWNETALMTWLLENFTQPVTRVVPLWKKSFSFERFFDGSPTLILFTPLNPLYEQLPVYGLLRETAMDYYNCKNNGSSQWVAELMKLQQVQRYLYQQKDFMKICQEYKFKKVARKPSHFIKQEVISQNNKYPWINVTEKNQKPGLFDLFSRKTLGVSKLDSSNDELLSSVLLNECSMKTLPTEKRYYDMYEQCQSIEENTVQDLVNDFMTTETTMLPFEDDPLSSENLVQENIKHFCKLMRFAAQFSPVVLPVNVENANLTDIHGLACARNRSLNMIALDSVHNHHFAESLGIDIVNKKDQTSVVILDSKEESQYVLSGEYSAQSVREFIYNFTNKKLKRALREHVEDAAHTHYFSSDTHTDTKDDRIIELTTKTFRRVIREPGQVTIVVVSRGGSGAGAARAARGAARLLRACGTRARAARLDAAPRDLPWQDMPTHYPAILVFDTTRGGSPESRAYPARARVSAAGVAALALRRRHAPAHAAARLALCRHTQANKDKLTCLKDLREYITTLIRRNLKYWHQAPNVAFKDALLTRLVILHHVSFHLSFLHVSDLSESDKLSSLLDFLSASTNSWDLDLSILKHNVTSKARSS